MLRMQIPRSHPQKIRSAFSTQLKPGKRVWTRTRPGDGQQTTDGSGSCVHRIVIMVEDAGAHHVQVLGSDVRFAAAHSTAGARSRESRGSGSPSSAEPRIGVSRSPSPPAAERSPSLPPSPPLLHPLSQTRPPPPPNAQVPRLEAGASAPRSHFQPLTEPISPPILSAPHSQLLGSGPPVLVQTLPPPPPQGHLASSRPVPRPFDPPLSKTQT